MSRAFIFWLIFTLWILAIFGAWSGPDHYRVYFSSGGDVTAAVLIGLLGWKTYGPAITG